MKVDFWIMVEFWFMVYFLSMVDFWIMINFWFMNDNKHAHQYHDSAWPRSRAKWEKKMLDPLQKKSVKKKTKKIIKILSGPGNGDTIRIAQEI